jgi:hypothetical protein
MSEILIVLFFSSGYPDTAGTCISGAQRKVIAILREIHLSSDSKRIHHLQQQNATLALEMFFRKVNGRLSKLIRPLLQVE